MKYRIALLTLTLAISTLGTRGQEQENVDFTGILNVEKFNESIYSQFDSLFLGNKAIGLGEATHGSSEFFELKAEMIKYLVSKRDYKLLIFESFFTDSELINQYISNGEGDSFKAIIGMGYYIYYTQEFLDLIEWLKSYNINKPERDKIKIYGCDMTAPQITSKKVKSILSEKNLLTQSLSKNLNWTIEHPVKHQYSKEEIKIIQELARELISTFKKLDEQDYLLQHYNRVLQQSFDYMLTKSGYKRSNKRNKYMAENALFIQKTLEQNSKMIIWEHNVHIAKQSGQDKIIPMGKHLMNSLQDSYYALGYGFNKGSFIALNNSTRNKEVISVKDATEGSSDFNFSKNRFSAFFIDFSYFKPDNKNYAWLYKKTTSRNIGAVYYPGEFNRNYRKHILSKSYDGLIFVNNSSPVKELDYRQLAK